MTCFWLAVHILDAYSLPDKRPESHRWTRDKHKNLPIRKHSEGKLMHFEPAWREQGLHNCLLPRSWTLPELKNEITIPDHPSTWCICVCSLPWGEKKGCWVLSLQAEVRTEPLKEQKTHMFSKLRSSSLNCWGVVKLEGITFCPQMVYKLCV